MLSTGDAWLSKRDRSIPGLATLLDDSALVAVLQTNLPSLNIQGIRPYYVNYKPGTKCLVAFHIKTADNNLIAYVVAYGPNAQIKLQKARELNNSMKNSEPVVLELEAYDAACYFFPIDCGLKSIRRLATPEMKIKLLRRVFKEHPNLCNGSLHFLRYKPERRLVARLDTKDGPKAVVKFYTPAGYEAASTCAEALNSRGPLKLARKLGHSNKHHILAFEWKTGCLLRDILVDCKSTTSEKTSSVELTGTALAQLHTYQSDSLKIRTHEDEHRRLQIQAVTIGCLCPELSKIAERLVRLIIRKLDETPPGMLTIHSDFYDQQVLLNNQEAMILDLDQAEQGDAAADLGLFIAHLERDGVRNTLPLPDVEIFADALVRGYRQIHESPPSKTIRLYTAMGLLYLAAEPFRHREAEWPERIEAILSRAEVILSN